MFDVAPIHGWPGLDRWEAPVGSGVSLLTSLQPRPHLATTFPNCTKRKQPAKLRTGRAGMCELWLTLYPGTGSGPSEEDESEKDDWEKVKVVMIV